MKNNKKKNGFAKLNAMASKSVKLVALDKIKGGKTTAAIIEDNVLV